MNLSPNFNDLGVFVLDQAAIESLKAAAQSSPLRRARFCLHSSNESSVQEMVIALLKDSVVEPHKHPSGKPESYHLIEGAMDVHIFDPRGHKVQLIPLRLNGARMYRIRGNVWHQPLAVSDYAVYHEVYTGPFNKLTDVFYKDWKK